ncbi:tRNA (adenosine(37)-N6)-dimethylallyltransferase MiaA [Hydrogenophaga sp.]|uniref:tRNA (adenosine(37)-N6)-dimethylallyltransferase MiaA n=1 Tax=Hydrogenophaga sp. TaxID=1904254 RepID=UPI002732C8D0|nr:tRNA (adenosine(37)-N6)-dimethylallyltransferase MiaA [Hydrogenophaga sp.]MDP3885848.1 tRNA (adenosine(37)-N6)-dimethylallyltransferase MiaA [Hydrogenophaga sp.]
MPAERPRCLAIAGPTASGKSAASMVIAQRWPVEIISVDSALVYRGMDIGTAKPSPAELAQVPHHLIDTTDPLQAYSAAGFVADATRLIGEIQARGRTPLLVGGTMLYFKALMQGLNTMPRADAAVRQAIEARAAQLGWPALHAELARVDPVTAARLFPNDSQRIQRALEVFELSGQPISAFQTGPDETTPGSPLAPGALLSLEPQDRTWLHARIAQRFDAMLAAGFLDEVRALRTRGDLHPDLPSMRCVGYRQAWEALDAADPPSTQQLAELRDRGIFATRQLAKRQITWLRSMPERVVVPCDAPDALAQVLQWAGRWLGAPTGGHA